MKCYLDQEELFYSGIQFHYYKILEQGNDGDWKWESFTVCEGELRTEYHFDINDLGDKEELKNAVEIPQEVYESKKEEVILKLLKGTEFDKLLKQLYKVKDELQIEINKLGV